MTRRLGACGFHAMPGILSRRVFFLHCTPPIYEVHAERVHWYQEIVSNISSFRSRERLLWVI